MIRFGTGGSLHAFRTNGSERDKGKDSLIKFELSKKSPSLGKGGNKGGLEKSYLETRLFHQGISYNIPIESTYYQLQTPEDHA